MLQLKDFMPVNFKKEKYTGSCKGMRFRMEKFEKEGEETPVLRVSVGPEPYSFDCTPEEEKQFLEVPLMQMELQKGQTGSMNGMRRNFPDGRKSAVCKNNKGKGKFLKNFCLINKNLIFC